MDKEKEDIESETKEKLDDDIEALFKLPWQSSLAPAMISPRG